MINNSKMSADTKVKEVQAIQLLKEGIVSDQPSTEMIVGTPQGVNQSGASQELFTKVVDFLAHPCLSPSFVFRP